jgi:hypothetical protein
MVDMFWTDNGKNLNALCEQNITTDNLLSIKMVLKMKTVGDNLVLFITEEKISIQSLNVNVRYSILLLLPFILLTPPLYPRLSSFYISVFSQTAFCISSTLKSKLIKPFSFFPSRLPVLHICFKYIFGIYMVMLSLRLFECHFMKACVEVWHLVLFTVTLYVCKWVLKF